MSALNTAGTSPERCFLGDSALRQREVEVPVIDLVRFGVDLGDTLAEFQFLVLRTDRPLLVEFVGEIVEDSGVLFDDRIDDVFRVEHAFGSDESEVLKVFELLFRHGRHDLKAP